MSFASSQVTVAIILTRGQSSLQHKSTGHKSTSSLVAYQRISDEERFQMRQAIMPGL